MSKNKIYIIIGVSGSGKSTVAKLLAEQVRAKYIDADDFHSSENIAKMSTGKPLTDSDRWPWLASINKYFIDESAKQSLVLACSALKEVYRQSLAKDVSSEIVWVSLEGSVDLIATRMAAREHFMPLELLHSQFATWEKPSYGLHLSIGSSPEEIVKKILESSKKNMSSKSEIGLVGLGVMGKSLSRNIAGRGFRLSVFNRHVDESEVDVAKNFVQAYLELDNTKPFDDLEAFVGSLQTPRVVFLMVNAGAAVDHVIEAVLPHLEFGDVIIDGGNSHYKDTERRYDELAKRKINYIGTGVSGGEEGALKGPSIMPGGSKEGYQHVDKIFSAIAAEDFGGNKCCAYIGKGGAGHFVKMVHNGIEYGEMQLLAEVYGVLRFHMGNSLDEIAAIFEDWLAKDSSSYLLEITKEIMLHKEEDKPIIDLILDKAGNKGTGSWTTIAACELGVAIPTLTAALFARYQSSYFDTRQVAAEKYSYQVDSTIDFTTEELRLAYQQARIINHHQGYELIAKASDTYDWQIDYKELSRIWTNGCIIRSKLMEQISVSLDNSQPKILLNDIISTPLRGDKISQLSKVVSGFSKLKISAPCFSTALNYINAYVEKKALANVIQAQRDYFGAHTYERVDDSSGKKYHTEWL